MDVFCKMILGLHLFIVRHVMSEVQLARHTDSVFFLLPLMNDRLNLSFYYCLLDVRPIILVLYCILSHLLIYMWLLVKCRGLAFCLIGVMTCAATDTGEISETLLSTAVVLGYLHCLVLIKLQFKCSKRQM